MKPNKTFIIRHKETKAQFHAASGKTSWKAAGHAKLAFNSSVGGVDYILGKYALKQSDFSSDGSGRKDYRFDCQNVYEIVELKHESEDRLTQAKQLLIEVLGRLADWELEQRITQFIKEVDSDLQ